MRRPPLLATVLLLAGFPLGCLPGPAPTNVPKAPIPLKRPVPSAAPSSNTIPIVPQASGAPATTTPNAVTLEGTIRLPAGIIGNNGSGLIGKIRFPGIVGNNGSSYRALSAVDQALAVGAEVQLVDAAGVAVKGADGQPLKAVTDEEGRFRFTTPLPSQNLVAVVQLPENKGAIQAIVPAGRKQVDADLVSTLTTGYILDQYVKGQQNPVVTLEKLPADVEATTRQKAQSALVGGTTAVPDALTTEKVVATVTALRQEDKSLDDQMETVKRLLVVAGISNLGDGRPASQLRLDIAEILPLPDGSAYIRPYGALFEQSSRIWRLRTDNTMEIAIGQGDAFEGLLTGMQAREVALDSVADTALDAQNRLLILEEERLHRLEADGTLTTLWTEVPVGDAVIAMPDGEVLVLTGVPEDTSFRVWSVAEGRSAELRATVPKVKTLAIHQALRHTDGQLYAFAETINDSGEYYRLDLQAAKLEKLAITGYMTAVGPQGHYALQRNPVQFLAPDTNTGPAFGAMPAGSVSVDAFGLFSNSKALIATDDRLYRVENQVWTPISRRFEEPHQVIPATTFDFMSPLGLAVSGDGQTYVCDSGLYRVYRIDTAGDIHLIAGGGKNYGKRALGKPALEVELDFLGKLRLAPDGSVCFADGPRVVKLDAQGIYREVYAAPNEDYYVDDFQFGPDGALYVMIEPWEDYSSLVVRVAPGATTGTTLHTGDDTYYGMTFHPDGTLYFMGAEELLSWTSAGGVKTVKKDTRFYDYPALLFDGQGRLLFGSNRQLLRYDLKADTFTAIAGPGGRVLNGTGADNSLNSLGDMAFDKAGNLLVTDLEHHQIKRIPADQL